MNHLKELLLGLLTSLATALIVLGALSISITEGMVFVPTQVSKSTPTSPDFDLTTLLPEQSHATTTTQADHIITRDTTRAPILQLPQEMGTLHH